MPDGLERRYATGDLHYITCSCYRRLPLLGLAGSRDVFVKILGEAHDQMGFKLAGYVVMPEHIHLLIGEHPTGTPSTVLQVLKQRVAAGLPWVPAWTRTRTDSDPALGESGDELPKFWEPRFYDFNVWSQKRKIQKLNYIHMNPVKRGLVGHPEDWRWSSFSFYAGRKPGMIRIDP